MLVVLVIVAIDIPKSGLLSTFPTCSGGDAFWGQCVLQMEGKTIILQEPWPAPVLLVDNLQTHGVRRAGSCVL